MLSIRNLHLSLGNQKLAKGFNLDLHPGEINVIIGPNGTGKSSLLRALFAELPVEQGDIVLHGNRQASQTTAQWRNAFGYMPQDIQLDVALSALEVTLLGQLNQLGLTLNEFMLHRGLTALEQVGMLDYADREVHTLSGGQRQMVLFAQVLLREPTVMMLDEPISALDLHHQQVLLEQLARQTQEKNWITLMVLHDLNLAAQYADRLIVLNDGHIAAHGTANEILTSDLIQQVYGVNVDVLHDETGCPFVRTQRYSNTEKIRQYDEAI